MKKVAVIFGGVSSEHDVSLVSAKSIIECIPKERYEVIALGITKDGRWFKYSGKTENLPNDKWLDDEKNLTPAIISPDRGGKSILLFNDNLVEKERIDVAFPVLHGKNGEDGTIQGLFQLAGIPFVGCDMLSSAMCMDKAVTNALADSVGILQAEWLGIKRNEYYLNTEGFNKKAIELLGLPFFVKPANTGSSVGISKVSSKTQIKNAMQQAFEHDEKVVIEANIEGKEVECAVLGNDNPQASVVGEIVPCNDFYDYDAKYIGDSQLHIPARIDDSKAEEIRAAALRVYSSLGCSGLSRIDFFIRNSDNAVLLNEVNTIPGFTSISMYPKLFEASGISYSTLLDKLITFAIEKWS
ncbi:MAG TPA: D-alanine--D-alanine ligase family protein [Clostridia bacterium]|nr:D-alanine--D-alanine ligase family protein [Clostridia bacterium]